MVGKNAFPAESEKAPMGISSTNSPNWIIVFLALEQDWGSSVPSEYLLQHRGTGAGAPLCGCRVCVLWRRLQKLVYEDMVAQLTPKLERET